MFGELIPFGGGDPIPMAKDRLLIGRRESCDVVLRFANVSAHHCELAVEQGYWFVKDLNSRNGTKVNGLRVTARKRVDPGDRLSIAKHHFEVRYSPADLGAGDGPPPDDTVISEILGQSLLESAGLDRKARQQDEGRIGIYRPEQDGPQEGEDASPQGSTSDDEQTSDDDNEVVDEGVADDDSRTDDAREPQ